MVRKSIDQKLEELSAKEKALKNRKAILSARKKSIDDKALTRKKILIGAYILEKYKSTPDDMKKLVKELDGFLIRNNDRDLFGLSSDKPQREKK